MTEVIQGLATAAAPTYAEGARGPLSTDLKGGVRTVPGAASTATLSAVASGTSSAQALAANTSRKGVIAVNTDANVVYLKYGTTASATSFTVRLAENETWVMPAPIYTGRIDAIWATDGAGSLYITELT